MEHFKGEIISGINPDTGLTAIQEKCAIMLASGAQTTDVAESLNIGRSTIYRWLGNSRFQCFCNAMKQYAKECAEGNLISLQAVALNNIKDSLTSDNEQLKMKVSMWVLDKALSTEIGEINARNQMLDAIHNTKGIWNEESAYKQMLAKAGMNE